MKIRLLVAGLVVASSAFAQDYPNKPIRLIVPYGAGGGSDFVGRLVGQKLTVISWLWVRTVKSPNPAFAQVDVPLASTFMLSRMKGNEAYSWMQRMRAALRSPPA